ncbi:MAG: DUF3267 domain-containing protein [Collinsella sp.]
MRSLSATVLVAGVLAAILWALAMVALREFFDALVTLSSSVPSWVALGDRLMGVEERRARRRYPLVDLPVVAIPATFAVHELVHALFFRHYAPPGAQITFGSNLKMGMIYASAEGVVYPRDAYLVIALAPSIIVTLLVIVLGIGFRWPLWTIVVATAHLSVHQGLGYVRAIRSDPTIAYCEDTAWGVSFYGAPCRLQPRRVSPSDVRATPRAADADGSHGLGSSALPRPAEIRSGTSGFSVVEGGKRL